MPVVRPCLKSLFSFANGSGLFRGAALWLLAHMANTNNATTRRDAAEAPHSLLDTLQACRVINISKRTLQERVASREIGHVKIGRSIRFHADDIAQFIEKNRVKAIGWKGKAQ